MSLTNLDTGAPAAAGSRAGATEQEDVKADLLLVNGRVLTMHGAETSGLAVVADRVVATGDSRELDLLRGPRTQVIDLRGRPALPGFTDSHLHLGALAQRLSQVDLSSARSLPAALRRVAARARRAPNGSWITGGGFDKNRWGDRFPSRRDLDRVAPANPVALSSRDGHSLWVNSPALARCRIGPATRAPAGGRILRDEGGRPTGILQETATRLVYDCDRFERPKAGQGELHRALKSLLRYGITSVHLMGGGDTLSVLQELRAAGRLPLRAALYPAVGALEALIDAGIQSGFGDHWLRIGGVKLLIDGALGSQTAWLFRPHENSDAGTGVAVLAGEELRAVVRRAAEAGLACAIHAIGDRANAEALSALSEARGLRPALPHRIEHAQLVRPRDIPRFARLGVVASMQPCHIPGDIDTAERYWGKRSRWAYPIRSLAAAGVTLAFGSDAPVETADPWVGVHAAIARQTPEGRPAGGWYRREEGITMSAALRGYTVGPAKATGEEQIKGKLARGYLADIVVLSKDIAGASGRGMAEVDLAFVGGRLRHRRRGAA